MFLAFCFNFKFPSVRNIFLFIRKFSNFLLFLVLQILSLYFLFTYNKFHQAAFMGVAGEFTGRISERYNNVEYYFKLKQTNEALSKQNEHLLNLLRQNYEGADTAKKYFTDTLRVDSLMTIQRFKYYDAKVVGSFVSMQNNYFTIHRGTKQGLPTNKEWGVYQSAGHCRQGSFCRREFFRGHERTEPPVQGKFYAEKRRRNRACFLGWRQPALPETHQYS